MAVKGNYLDNDIADAEDIYGKTKAEGEVISPNTLTIRCSVLAGNFIILQNCFNG